MEKHTYDSKMLLVKFMHKFDMISKFAFALNDTRFQVVFIQSKYR